MECTERQNERLVANFITFMRPMGKARPRHTASGVVFTPKATRIAEQIISWDCVNSMARSDYSSKEPCRVCIKATFKVPKYRTNEGLIGDPVIKKPDADNIAKLVLDALNGVAYKDDSQVFSIEVEKVWAEFDSVQVWVFETIPNH
jgi:Holliday junction resolvase RusA-like endonuclease